MKATNLYFSILLSISLLSSCGQKNENLNKVAMFVPSNEYLCIIQQGRIKFYDSPGNWIDTHNEFNIPPNSALLFFLRSNGAGVRKGNVIEFYDEVRHSFAVNKGNDLNVHVNIKDVILYQRYIGVSDGKVVKFYENKQVIDNAPAKWALLPDHDFPTPGGNDQVIAAGDDLGVRNGNTIKFYTYQGQRWGLVQDEDFSVPNDADEVNGWWTGAIVMRKGYVISFYEFDKDSNSWLVNHQMDFTIKQ